MARSSFLATALRSRWVLLIAFLLVIGLGFAFGRQVLRNRQIQGDIARLEKQGQELTARNVQIGQLQDALQTESYLEQEARLKLGMMKPGEHVVVVQDKPTETPAFQSLEALTTEADKQEVPKVSNPRRWWLFFFDRPAYQDLVSRL